MSYPCGSDLHRLHEMMPFSQIFGHAISVFYCFPATKSGSTYLLAQLTPVSPILFKKYIFYQGDHLESLNYFNHTAICMQGSCVNSPHPSLCGSFRCREEGNFTTTLIRLWKWYQSRIIGEPSQCEWISRRHGAGMCWSD